MKSKKELEFSLLCSKAINLQRVFSRLKPLIYQSRLLSLNAEVICAHVGEKGGPFSIVARELIVIIDSLDELILEIEGVFFRVVQELTNWIKTESQAFLYIRALEISKRWEAPGPAGNGNGRLRAEGLVLLESGLGDYLDRAAINQSTSLFEKMLYRELIQARARIFSHLEGLRTTTSKLNGHIERINRVAVRQARLTAISAQIEAAHLVSINTKFKNVANDFEQLSYQIGDIQSTAKEQIESLLGMIIGFLQPIQDEMRGMGRRLIA